MLALLLVPAPLGVGSTDVDILRKDSNVAIEVIESVKLLRGSWSIVLHLDTPVFPNFEPWLGALEQAIATHVS